MKNPATLTDANIRRYSWKRLAAIWETTRDKSLRARIEKEARRCGYRMEGFILARALSA